MTDIDIDCLVKELKRYKLHIWKSDTFEDLSVPWKKKKVDVFQANLDARLEQLRTEGKEQTDHLRTILSKLKEEMSQPKSTGRGARQGKTPQQRTAKTSQGGLSPGAIAKSPEKQTKDELRRAEEQIMKLKTEKEEQTKIAKQMEDTLGRAEEQIMELKTEKEEQTKILSSVYETTSDLKQDGPLTSIQYTSTRLYQRCLELDEENKALKMQIKQIEYKPMTREADIHHLNQRWKELQKQNTELEERLKHSQKYHQENDELRQRCSSIESQRAELEKQLLREKEKFEGLECEKNQLQERSDLLGSKYTDLEQQLLRENEKVRRLENEKQHLQESIKKLKIEKSDITYRYLLYAGDVESTKKQKKNLDARIQQLLKQNTELEERLKISQKDCQDKDELLQRCSSTESQRAELKKQLLREKEKVERLECEKNQLQERSHSLGREHTDLRQQLLQEKEKITRLEYENNQLQERNKKLKAAKIDCTDRYLQCTDDVESAKKEKANLEAGMKELQKKNTELEERLKHSQEDHQENDDLRLRLLDLQKHNGRLDSSVKNAIDKCRQLEKEKDDLLNRFSQCTSGQLTHDNPNIPDLSDPNRPTRIVEQLSELYDNQWTDACDTLADIYRFSEEKTITTLRILLDQAYAFCVDSSETQDRDIKLALQGKFSSHTMSPEIAAQTELDLATLDWNMIADLKKRTNDSSVKVIVENFLTCANTFGLVDVTDVKEYVIKCAEVCWHMVLHSPQLYLESCFEDEEMFDTKKYNYYKTKGSKYKFVVWPVLYLHKDGPVLSKGIAEAQVNP